MPYKSEKHRRHMRAQHPEIAERWDKKYGTKIQKKKKGFKKHQKKGKMP